MKPGTLIIKIVTWVFFLGAIAYFAVYTAHVLFHDYETATLYSSTAEDAIEASGCIVRKEETLKSKTKLTEIVAAEAETIGVGDTLAMIYENEEALQRDREISELKATWESLRYILSHSADASDSAVLNQHIINSIADLRNTASSGAAKELYEQTQELKSLMFRRDYTYNGSTALNEEITVILKEIERLSTENRSHTQNVVSPKSGIFSSLVDGYELVFTPKAIRDLTPEGYDKLVSGKKSIAEGDYMGKLVTGSKWYFAANLSEENAERLNLGGWYSIRFNSMARVVRMKVQSISKPDQEERVCVVFIADHYLAETTLLRDQTVDIIFDTVSGFYVDKSALHVENQTGQAGIYRIYGAQVKWVAVDTVWEDENYYLVTESKQYDEDGEQHLMSELEGARQLRNGVEVVSKGTNLYDGKVIK